MNHCSFGRGSMMPPVRSAVATFCAISSSFSIRPRLTELFGYDLARFGGLLAVHELICDGHLAVFVDHRDERQAVALGDLPVDHAVRRRDTERSRAEILFDGFVGNHFNLDRRTAEIGAKRFPTKCL